MQQAARIGGGDSLEEGQELLVPMPVGAGLGYLPLAALIAAIRVVVRCRTESKLGLRLPGRAGSVAAVRSSTSLVRWLERHPRVELHFYRPRVRG
jgi:hypothetical protein